MLHARYSAIDFTPHNDPLSCMLLTDDRELSLQNLTSHEIVHHDH